MNQNNFLDKSIRDAICLQQEYDRLITPEIVSEIEQIRRQFAVIEPLQDTLAEHQWMINEYQPVIDNALNLIPDNMFSHSMSIANLAFNSSFLSAFNSPFSVHMETALLVEKRVPHWQYFHDIAEHTLAISGPIETLIPSAYSPLTNPVIFTAPIITEIQKFTAGFEELNQCFINLQPLIPLMPIIPSIIFPNDTSNIDDLSINPDEKLSKLINALSKYINLEKWASIINNTLPKPINHKSLLGVSLFLNTIPLTVLDTDMAKGVDVFKAFISFLILVTYYSSSKK